MKYTTINALGKEMNRLAIVEKYGLEEFNNDTWSNPKGWNGDVEFGTCDLTGKKGDLEPMQCLDLNGELVEFEVLTSVAYKLHGLAGAY